MPHKRIPATAISVLPPRHWIHGVSRAMLIGAGLTLLVMSKTGNPVAANLRTAILDTVTPFIAAAASPFDAIAGAGAWMTSVVDMRAENIALKNQNIQLLQWQAAAKRMEAENASLKRLLHVVPAKKSSYVTVHLVSDFGGPYAQSALINGGVAQGIAIDQAVINEDGLVGRVIETGETSARVLLLGDINSRVPVMTEHSRERSMLTGTNGRLPVLNYLPAHNAINVGDRIVTSGDGGIFPAGIPVGVVASIEGHTVTVQPFADITRIEYVSAIDYSF